MFSTVSDDAQRDVFDDSSSHSSLPPSLLPVGRQYIVRSLKENGAYYLKMSEPIKAIPAVPVPFPGNSSENVTDHASSENGSAVNAATDSNSHSGDATEETANNPDSHGTAMGSSSAAARSHSGWGGGWSAFSSFLNATAASVLPSSTVAMAQTAASSIAIPPSVGYAISSAHSVMGHAAKTSAASLAALMTAATGAHVVLTREAALAAVFAVDAVEEAATKSYSQSVFRQTSVVVEGEAAEGKRCVECGESGEQQRHVSRAEEERGTHENDRGVSSAHQRVVAFETQNNVDSRAFERLGGDATEDRDDDEILSQDATTQNGKGGNSVVACDDRTQTDHEVRSSSLLQSSLRRAAKASDAKSDADVNVTIDFRDKAFHRVLVEGSSGTHAQCCFRIVGEDDAFVKHDRSPAPAKQEKMEHGSSRSGARCQKDGIHAFPTFLCWDQNRFERSNNLGPWETFELHATMLTSQCCAAVKSTKDSDDSLPQTVSRTSAPRIFFIFAPSYCRYISCNPLSLHPNKLSLVELSDLMLEDAWEFIEV